MAATIPEVYYIVGDYGQSRQSVISWEDCSKQAVILDLMRGDTTRPIEVHCIDQDGGTWRNVSEDIAREIVSSLQEPATGELFDFLENHLGVRFMADLEREMEEGRSDFDEHNVLNRAQQGV